MEEAETGAQKIAGKYPHTEQKIVVERCSIVDRGFSEKTLYRDLQDLVNKGVLQELGKKKGRKYELG
jgi:predicted HTH transcriptional regulator